MEFPRLNISNGNYTFHYFNYGYRGSKNSDLYVDVLIKENNSDPVCHREIFIQEESKALEEVSIFEKAFSLEPEKYRNIKVTKE